jgi:hypothetical protein
MIHTICFFNHWHNGDVFSAKGFIQNLIRQVPDRKFQHAQLNSLKTMQDLNCEQIHTDQLPPGITDRVRFHDVDGTLYVNTWIGCYGNDVIPVGQHHANYPSLYTMWGHIYTNIGYVLERELIMPQNLAEMVANTNWSKYDISPALQFLGQHGNIVLLCNGAVRSTQSNLDDLASIVKTLATEFTDVNFVCTQKFSDTTNLPGNIHFTEDIFAGVQGGDVNEIAYISTQSFLIVGKNSGPFMFTHVVENLTDPNKAFVSLSHRSSDSYVWGTHGLGCRYYHYSGDDQPNTEGVIRQAIKNRGQIGPGMIEEIPNLN